MLRKTIFVGVAVAIGVTLATLEMRDVQPGRSTESVTAGTSVYPSVTEVTGSPDSTEPTQSTISFRSNEKEQQSTAFVQAPSNVQRSIPAERSGVADGIASKTAELGPDLDPEAMYTATVTHQSKHLGDDLDPESDLIYGLNSNHMTQSVNLGDELELVDSDF